LDSPLSSPHAATVNRPSRRSGPQAPRPARRQLWVAETGANAIARVTPAGAITEFALPGGVLPSAVTAGPGGNI